MANLKTEPFRSDTLTLTWFDLFRLIIGVELVCGALKIRLEGWRR